MLWRAVVYGLGRTPSLVFIALFFVVAAFLVLADRPLILLLPFGLLTVAVVVAVVLDTIRSRAILQEALSEPLSTAGLRSARLRECVRRAIDYRRELRAALLERYPDTADLAPVEDAAVLVHRLCTNIQRYEDDRLLAEDTRRLQQETSLTPGEREHLQSLQELQQEMRNAEQQALEMLATLGESYASLRRLEAVPETDGRAPEVLARLRNSSQVLRDRVHALEEMYNGLATGGSGATI